ncbi:hypothetical protein P280DRAFT_397205 [Massarina eburnea CBS 473.64]|uniref:Glycosyltransferase family 2 protein n=1 Tax=Massarina eburnea CBS 473.64 TaxID=1395130 RepID=A0A6A6S4Z6_9PLEO|nr:hypothetical protein P280DRAFT_397205 [Massarina eburnea CBS 473.64]
MFPQAITVVAWFATTLFAWILYLIYKIRTCPKPQISFLASLGLFGHLWPAVLLYVSAKKAEYSNDSALIWFFTLVAFRHYKTIINIFFWLRYKPSVASPNFKLTGSDCTVIVPTVGPEGNTVFAETVSSILFNHPDRLIFSTNTEEAKTMVEKALPEIVDALTTGTSAYQVERDLDAIQTVNGFREVQTEITVMVDDTAIWTPKFLDASLPAFENEKVAFVGTKKWVKCLPHTNDPNKSWLGNAWNNYVTGFWNAMGGIYLIPIVKDGEFQKQFLNEFVKIFSSRFTYGPLASDDDNFITRWVINHGFDVKVQYSDEATMTTILGKWPKFTQQCLRWSRTTFRQNPLALTVDRTIWWKWPISVWTTYIPWLWNAALLWDGLMIFGLSQTELYKQTQHPGLMMACLVTFIYATKLIKTAPWFWKNPHHFLLYFFPIPAYLGFAYYHSLLKVYTCLTLGRTDWSGRTLPQEDAQPRKDST